MTGPDKSDPAREWLTTLSWTDMLIAKCFPRFFRKYAPEELVEQWAEYQAKKLPRE